MPADERDTLCKESSRKRGSDLATADHHLVNRVRTGIESGVAFVRRQPRQWIVTAVRSSLAMFLYNIVAPYLSVYTMQLGASATQLGIVNSVGMAAAGVIAPFIGWIIDRRGVRVVYLVGIAFLAISYLTYAVAGSWAIVILAMVAYWLGRGMSGQGCSTICGNSIRSEDRATAMSLCETLAAGVLGMLAPLVGAALVARFGGVSAGGIRPLFFVALAGTIGTFVMIYILLPNCRWTDGASRSRHLLRDLFSVLRSKEKLGRWLVIDAIGFLPMGMVIPFAQPFAHDVKGANELILGMMIAAFALTPLILGIPIGRIADRIGRKRVLYVTIPLSWLSSVALILAPNSGVLVLSGVLLGFFTISAVTAGAMAYELVPKAHMGRWLGIAVFFRMLLAAAAASLAGVIWDQLGPAYVFLTVIGLELLIRMPLLITMPETLHLTHHTESGEPKAP
jgi:MFS family permease